MDIQEINKEDNSKKNKTGKKKIKLNADAFNGISTEYKPTVAIYDFNKVGFGIWDFKIKFPSGDDKEPIGNFSGVYRNGFIDFLTHYGFRKKFRSDSSYFLLRCIDNTIEEVDTINISDFVIDYLEKNGADILFNENIEGDSVEFTASLLLQKETIKKQCHSLFNKKFLEMLPTFDAEILKDTPTECFKLFKNRIVKITSESMEVIEYKDLKDKFVWKKHIIDFDFEYTDNFTECHYYKFIYNVSNAATEQLRHTSFISAIGYLLHKYNSPEKGQAIICYDEKITDLNKPQGGTGKGVFAKALAKLSELIKIDGKKFDENDRFCFQRISDSTQIVFFDDVKNKLGFDRFNSILTDGWNIEKKNKDEFAIPPEDSPKVLIGSNSILECEGSTRKRRQFILEFSDFYSKHIKKGNEVPIKDIHKCVFFSDDWDETEWQMFYSFMIYCICQFMQNGLVYYEPKNVVANRLRQITNDDFAEWVTQQNFEVNKVYETKPLFEVFKSTYYGDDVFSQRKFTGFLKKYATLSDWGFKQPPASSGRTFFQFT